MSQKQAKVTNYFQKRRHIRSPPLKRLKFDGESEIKEESRSKSSTPEPAPSKLAPKKSFERVEPKFTKIVDRPKPIDEKKDKVTVEKETQIHASVEIQPKINVETPILASPTKLNAQELRNRLGKVRNLHELRQRLASFSESAARLNDKVDEAKNGEIERKHVEYTKELPAVETFQNSDDDDNFVPAYQRYAHLVTNAFDNLELPVAHQILLNTFRAADQLVSIMYNRLELITFEKLKKGVQEMTRKNFEKKHLGQFKTVYPESYKFEIMQVKSKHGYNYRSDEHALTIKPNMETDLKSYQINTPAKTPSKNTFNADTNTPPSSPVKANVPPRLRSPLKSTRKLFSPTKSSPRKIQIALEPEPTVDRIKPLSGARLVCRTEIFKKNLYNMLAQEHRKFLGSLSPPIVLTKSEESSMRRWHPKFPLNSLPEIAAADLPQPPVVDKVFSAKDILKTDKSKSFPIQVQNALESAAEMGIQPQIARTTEQIKNDIMKGIPAGLLEKIKAKESLRYQKSFLRSSEEDVKRNRLTRLPEMVKIIKMHFATENKAVLSVDLVSKKLFDSYKSLISKAEIEVHLKMLLENASEWLTKTSIQGKGEYLRMNKAQCVNDVVAKLTNMLVVLD